jgi:hypothetical protein
LNAFACLREYGQADCGFPIWERPIILMNIAMWEYCAYDNEIFRYGKIYYSNSIIITDYV